MIGGNVPDAYTPFEIRTGPSGSPHATKTRLGWIIWNVTRPPCSQESSQTVVVNRTYVSKVEECSKLEELVQQSVKLDFPERIKDDKRENSREDVCFLNNVHRTVQYKNGHFTIDLPFRSSECKLPNNKSQALQRLKGLTSKFNKNPKFKEDYISFMDKLLSNGHAELVPENQLDRNDGHVWFLPHHGFYHPRKPDKIRVVFDCSAVYAGVSLNRQLLQGPDLTNNLLGVVLRFRQDSVAVLGDIEAMFHQVRVPEKDRDNLRFLWWPNGNLEQEPKEYRMTVHLFGATSSPSCCNFAIKQTADIFGNLFESNAKEVLSKNMYVDDCLFSVSKEEEAEQMISDLSSLCQMGGFHVTKWTSNKPNVVLSIPEEERGKEVKQWDFNNDHPTERALGIYWLIEEDKFGFKISLKDQSVTRRGILSIVSSIYDPLGIVAPFVLVGKIILQNLCQLKIGWDDEIPETERKKWIDWLSQIPSLEEIEIRRCYKPVDFCEVKSCEIHCFSDASSSAYGMVFYLRLVNNEGVIHCSFLLGKARVAPLKTVTIPRLELTAAARAVSICNKIKEEILFKVDSTYFWTDSMSVLRYIYNKNAIFHTFVANRLAVIHDSTSEEQWNYIDSGSNPADCASRGLKASKLSTNSVWLQGPKFLLTPREEWPKCKGDLSLQSSDTEVKREKVVSSGVVYDSDGDVMITLLSKFSNWNKLKRVTAWMLKFIHNLKESHSSKSQESTRGISNVKFKDCHLTTELIQEAEQKVVQYVQRRSFVEEYEVLSECNKSVSDRNTVKRSSKLYQLNVFLKDGIIRVGGRIGNSDVSYEVKHPIVLPKDSPLSKLIIESIHREIGHLGKNSVLSVLRQRFWIIGANSVIKSMLSKCVICKKYQGSLGKKWLIYRQKN